MGAGEYPQSEQAAPAQRPVVPKAKWFVNLIAIFIAHLVPLFTVADPLGRKAILFLLITNTTIWFHRIMAKCEHRETSKAFSVDSLTIKVIIVGVMTPYHPVTACAYVAWLAYLVVSHTAPGGICGWLELDE